MKALFSKYKVASLSLSAPLIQLPLFMAVFAKDAGTVSEELANGGTLCF
jgi:membrane protein insertase Oxa1/YidC/SpoIIIJ